MNNLAKSNKNEPAQEIKNPEWCSYKSSTCGHQKYKDKCKKYCRFFIE